MEDLITDNAELLYPIFYVQELDSRCLQQNLCVRHI